jgi:DNA-binding MarR family transcriptional regulator
MVTRQKGLKPAPSSRADQVRSGFEAQYPAYQYNMVEFITGHLADLSRAFRGDLQEMLVLAIIGQLAIRAHRAALAEPNPTDARRLGTAISASRLADVTAIPRQTVRRKLKSLEERGWIERADGASYQLAVRDGDAAARQDLSAVDQRSIERAARLFCGLERIVAETSS